MINDPLDVAILMGFLGDGKTTLLEGWLKKPDWNRTAVIVNELGATGITNICWTLPYGASYYWKTVVFVAQGKMTWLARYTIY